MAALETMRPSLVYGNGKGDGGGRAAGQGAVLELPVVERGLLGAGSREEDGFRRPMVMWVVRW
jgi:hypothetical protein